MLSSHFTCSPISPLAVLVPTLPPSVDASHPAAPKLLSSGSAPGPHPRLAVWQGAVSSRQRWDRASCSLKVKEQSPNNGRERCLTQSLPRTAQRGDWHACHKARRRTAPASCAHHLSPHDPVLVRESGDRQGENE